MKQFLKYTLATITGIFVMWIIGGLLLFLTIVGIVAGSSEKTPVVKPNSVYQLELEGTLVETFGGQQYGRSAGQCNGKIARKIVGAR